MLNFIKKFRADENGAVTVDWVVLTAAVVALAGAAYGSVSGGAATLTGNIENSLNFTPETGL